MFVPKKKQLFSVSKHETTPLKWVALPRVGKPYQEGILEVTDWLNRGFCLSGLIHDSERSLIYASVARTAEMDLAIFKVEDKEIKYIGTLEGFGSNIFLVGEHLGAVRKDGGITIWNMAEPLAPQLLCYEEKVKALMQPL